MVQRRTKKITIRKDSSRKNVKGGILSLNDKELDILGFDKYWRYDKDEKYPYMWAEANNYFYKGF